MTTPYIRSRKINWWQFFWIAILFVAIGACIVACTPTQMAQTPQIIYNITDNSQVIVADGGAMVVAKPENKTDQTAKPTSEIKQESITKNGMWIVWIVLIGIVTAGTVFIWLKYFKK
ncbi:MAG: hypothetical protein FWG80_04510 [Alphaproteobacteria bacterium]|nr:hypothetical protein [Alphaproteobacteria bacterium]